MVVKPVSKSELKKPKYQSHWINRISHIGNVEKIRDSFIYEITNCDRLSIMYMFYQIPNVNVHVLDH